MRLRNVKGAREIIKNSPFTIQVDDVNPGNYQGKCGKLLFPDSSNQPIHLEIGMGKGRFLHQLAFLHPEINYIGIEKFSSVLVRAIEKIEQEENCPANLFFLRMEAENISDFFAPAEISRIYLNFSDPWPKDRHAKRRLTSTDFLSRYEKILTPGGDLLFKTDNRPLFDFSLEEIKNKKNWTLDEVNTNLPAQGPAPNNIMTEYEQKFYQLGNPICRLQAHYCPSARQ